MDQAARIALIEQHVRSENLHDLDAVMATFGADARYDDEPWGDHRQGRDGVESYYAELLRALPDLVIEVVRRHVSSDGIVLEVNIRGTHRGAWRDLPATGRRVDFPLCGVYSFDADDRLAGERIYYDRATVLRQLGVFREPSSWLGMMTTALAHPVTIARAFARGRRISRQPGGSPPPPTVAARSSGRRRPDPGRD
jgi:steroid delta-isomerase-like uncharacterized protein